VNGTAQACSGPPHHSRLFPIGSEQIYGLRTWDLRRNWCDRHAGRCEILVGNDAAQ
jgi:hypothetical protein